MSLTVENGSLVVRDGKLGTGPECCCVALCGGTQCAADEYCCSPVGELGDPQCVKEGDPVPYANCCISLQSCGDYTYAVPNPLSGAFPIETDFGSTNANGVPLCPPKDDIFATGAPFAISFCGECDGCPEGSVPVLGGARIWCNGEWLTDSPCYCCPINSFP